MLELGQSIPSVQVHTTQGQFNLSELAGRWLVLYFYPKDHTPGCTQEGQEFAALYAQFQALNAQVIGVSRDSLRTHQNFATKHALPFALLSDPDEQLCLAFDVMRDKKLYGKPVRGIERSSFLFNPAGVLVAQWRKVKVESHAASVLATLQQQQGVPS